jgi:hypothetical protein
MILWRKGGNHTSASYSVMVQPGVFNPGVSDFFDKDGKPILFNVEFRYGKSDDLPDNLARYILDQGLAQETRFILP